MIDFYNAFISYKHGPRDNKVAAHVQSQLEHFHIPGKLRKKTGKGRIQRIFRDKDELPITSNLTETIENALQKSEYLIVICSTHTKESIWVRREIEFFLKTHDRDHILAVLSEGEPQDVLPKELLEEEVIGRNPDGTTYTYLREKEPLCCDYRGSFRKADNEELPRLAAALIGCSYDELMNRRRAYQMQRITILALVLTTLALGFMGYMTYSKNKLQKSYNETLRNQSLYLANESEKLLSEQQRIDAIHLALAALPSEDQDRPVTSEAIHALTEATLAYSPVSGTSIHAVWNYEANSQISKMEISPKHTSLACVDDLSNVIVWDTETHEVLIQETLSGQTIYSLSYLGDDYLLVTTSAKYIVYEISDGDVLWSKKAEDTPLRSMDPIIPEDQESFYLLTTKYELLHISTKKGNLLDSISLKELLQGESLDNYDNFIISPEGNKIAFSINKDFGDLSVAVLDLESNKISQIKIPNKYVYKIHWNEDGTVMVCGRDNYIFQGSTATEYRLLTPTTYMIYCMDFSSESILWSQEFVFNSIVMQSGFLSLPAKKAVAFYCGNLVRIYDCKTGEVLHNYDTNYSVVEVNDNDGDGTPLFITVNGGLIFPAEASGPDTSTLTFEFSENLEFAKVGGGIFTVQQYSNQIVFYNVHVGDEDWTEIDEDVTMHMIRDESDFYLDNFYLIVRATDGVTSTISAFDARNRESLWQIQMDPEIGSNYSLLGVFEDELYLFAEANAEDELLRIDMETGEILEKEFISKLLLGPKKDGSLSDGYLTYIYKDEKTQRARIRIVDLDSGNEEDFTLPLDVFYPQLAPRYFQGTDSIYYSDRENGDYIVAVGADEIYEVDLPKDWSGTQWVDAKEHGGNWIIADNSRILILSEDGEISLEISSNGNTPLGAIYYGEGKNEQIIVLYDNGFVIRYQAEDGTFIAKTDASYYVNAKHPAKLFFSKDKKTLFIQNVLITSVIDTSAWVEVAYVQNSMGYHEPTDSFFAFSYTSSSEYRIGYFRHYTLQDLIDKANKILGGATLSKEKKSAYGIK